MYLYSPGQMVQATQTNHTTCYMHTVIFPHIQQSFLVTISLMNTYETEQPFFIFLAYSTFVWGEGSRNQEFISSKHGLRRLTKCECHSCTNPNKQKGLICLCFSSFVAPVVFLWQHANQVARIGFDHLGFSVLNDSEKCLEVISWCTLVNTEEATPHTETMASPF